MLLLRDQRTVSPLFCQGAYYLLLDAETQQAVYGVLNDAFLIHKLEDVLTLGAQRQDPDHALIRVHVHQVYDLDQVRHQGQALWQAGKTQELANFLAQEVGLPGDWAEGSEKGPSSPRLFAASQDQEAPPFTQFFPKEGPGDKALLHVLAQINQDFEKGTVQQNALDGPLPRLVDLRHLDPTGSLGLCDLLEKYLDADPRRENLS